MGSSIYKNDGEGVEHEEEVGLSKFTFTPPLAHQRKSLVRSSLGVSSAFPQLVDIGCGEGETMIPLLGETCLKERTLFGLDIEAHYLTKAAERIKQYFPSNQFVAMQQYATVNIHLMKGDICNICDWYIADSTTTLALSAIEVMEHLQESQLESFCFSIFGHLRPACVVLTTPNSEFNCLFNFEPTQKRHADHKFEMDRLEFQNFCDAQIERYGDYCYLLVGMGLPTVETSPSYDVRPPYADPPPAGELKPMVVGEAVEDEFFCLESFLVFGEEEEKNEETSALRHLWNLPLKYPENETLRRNFSLYGPSSQGAFFFHKDFLKKSSSASFNSIASLLSYPRQTSQQDAASCVKVKENTEGMPAVETLYSLHFPGLTEADETLRRAHLGKCIRTAVQADNPQGKQIKINKECLWCKLEETGATKFALFDQKEIDICIEEFPSSFTVCKALGGQEMIEVNFEKELLPPQKQRRRRLRRRKPKRRESVKPPAWWNEDENCYWSDLTE